MADKKLGFEDFIGTVGPDDTEFVTALHQDFTQAGCKLEVKEAKSGYVVSYLRDKKTVMNYVFRKKGLIVRIYPNHLPQYMDLLETLPAGMVKEVEDAPLCKRLIDPAACNPKCAMGYDFILGGKRHQKCRYSAFMFLVCQENNSAIQALVQRELTACG